MSSSTSTPNGTIKVSEPIYGSTAVGLIKGGSGVFINSGSSIYYYFTPAQNVTSVNITSLFSSVDIYTSTSATFDNDDGLTYSETAYGQTTNFGFVSAMWFNFYNPTSDPYVQSIEVNINGYPGSTFKHPVPYDPFTKYDSLFTNGISNLDANTQYMILSCSVLPGADTSNIMYSNATMDSNLTFTVPNVYNVFTCTNLHSYYITSNSTTLASIKTYPHTMSNEYIPTPSNSNLVSYSGYLLGDIPDFTFSGNTSVYVNGVSIVPHNTISISDGQIRQMNIYGDSTTTLITDVNSLIQNNKLFFKNPYSNVDSLTLPTISNTSVVVSGSIVNVLTGYYTIHIKKSSFAAVYFDNVEYTDGSVVHIYDNTVYTTQFRVEYTNIEPIITITLVNTTITYNIKDVCRTITPIEIPAFINSNTAIANYKTYLL